MLTLLALGLLFISVTVLSSMLNGEESGGEMRTKSLMYDTDAQGKIGLYWMEDEAKTSKATPEEIERCEEQHPDEAVPICQTIYYKKDENEK
jgi:hypothetical protein